MMKWNAEIKITSTNLLVKHTHTINISDTLCDFLITCITYDYYLLPILEYTEMIFWLPFTILLYSKKEFRIGAPA